MMKLKDCYETLEMLYKKYGDIDIYIEFGDGEGAHIKNIQFDHDPSGDFVFLEPMIELKGDS